MAVAARSWWSRTHGASSWTLVVLFAFLALAHVVLTTLFYLGVQDQGFGYIFGREWPAWLITVVDGTAAWLLWYSHRRCTDRQWLGLALTLAAAVLVLGRASWMIFVPVLVVIVIAGSVARVLNREPATAGT